MPHPVAESSNILLDAWLHLAHGGPAPDSRRDSPIELVWSGYDMPFFNLAVTTATPSSLEDFTASFDDTSAWAAARKSPWLVTLCEETLGNLYPAAHDHLTNHGWAPLFPMTGMEASTLTPATRPAPAGTLITESDPTAGATLLAINSAAYQVEFGAPGTFAMESTSWWGAPSRWASVFLDPTGTPVSCAAVFNVHNLPYVALVATHPDAQRRGYAEVVLRDVISRALAAGLSPAPTSTPPPLAIPSTNASASPPRQNTCSTPPPPISLLPPLSVSSCTLGQPARIRTGRWLPPSMSKS